MADPAVAAHAAVEPGNANLPQSAGQPELPDPPPAPPPTKAQGLAAWIFGGVLLVFFGFVAYYPPKINQSIQYAALTVLAAILAGLFGYFITGTIVATGQWQITPKLTLNTKGTGGFAFAIIATGIFLFLNPYKNTGQAASDFDTAKNTSSVALSAPADQGAGASGTQEAQAAPSAEITVTPQIQAQAAKLAAADPKFSNLAALTTNSKVAIGTFTAAINAIRTETGQPQADVTALERDFGDGIGKFKLGMTVQEANALLPVSNPKLPWEKLQKANEYTQVDVRSEWAYLANFKDEKSNPFSPSLDLTSSCWSGKSFAVLLFTERKLTRISVRFTEDCGQRNQFMQTIATRYSIHDFQPNGPLGFLTKLSRSTVASYIGGNGAIFEVSENGSLEVAKKE
jgi:hypothetical protein